MTPQTEPDNAPHAADNTRHVYVTPQNLRRFKHGLKEELRPDMATHPATRCRRVITGGWPKLAQPHNGNTYLAKCRLDGLLEFKLNAWTVIAFMNGSAETLPLEYTVPQNGNTPVIFIGFKTAPFQYDAQFESSWSYNLLNPGNTYGVVAEFDNGRMTLRKTGESDPHMSCGPALVAAIRFPHVKAGRRYYVSWENNRLLALPTKPKDAVADGLPAPDADSLELSDGCISPVCKRYAIRVQYRTRIKQWDAAQEGCRIRRVWGCKKRVGNREHPVRLKPICVFRACFTLARCNDKLAWGADRMRSPWSVFTVSRGRLKRLG